ncbi:S8 family serine peptidase [Anabaenopsis sp. FSS-46]|uniref:S8 family serine peptidase n=1 Tax=Anabaenopsis sp. FSS-46 TaxID=2971766 RepID=UPI002474CE3C|nr:S8 family serine peptidase [Anabaenopsis sp. FSS-46]MDH6097491.1 S8 family serine peptidase [Anabaenopsis sp. FSS-46]
MKSHILIKLRTRISKQIPDWRQFILEKQQVITELHPEVDTLLSSYHLSIWVTHEYKPALEEWSYSELATGLDRVYRIILQEERPIPPIVIEKLSYLPLVEEVRMGEVVESSLPSIQLSLQKPLTDLRSRKSIYLPEAHELTEGDPRIIVAILDTGVFPDHLEYQDSLLPGMDFVNIIDGERKFIGDYLGYDEDSDDDVGHGTHVAGIISAKGYNLPKGVVPQCKILPVRVLGTMLQGNKRVGAGLIDNINTGIKWAIDHGADVINMSLGIQHQGGGLPHKEMVDYAKHKGVTMVAASGNSGKEQLYYPGELTFQREKQTQLFIISTS